jgi:hypothetical protein
VTRTYGKLQYGELPNIKAGRRAWLIQAEPYVMTRVKRMFGRVNPQRGGGVLITDTPDVARDLEWLVGRYPLDMSEETRAALTREADKHRAREETVQRVFSGDHLNLDLREPVREPRWYQRVASDLAIATGRLLVTDPLGAGKTMTGAMVLRAPDALPALVVTLAGRMPEQWAGEIQKTLPWLKTHLVRTGTPYGGNVPQRYHHELAAADVLVMSYAKLAGWADHLAGVAKTVIFDEVQELRHAHTLRWTAAAQIADRATYRVGLSNTPIYGYGQEAWNVVSVIAPDVLGEREEFLREWCTDAGNGKYAIREPVTLGAYLRDQGVVLGRSEDELGIVLPPPQRIVHTVEADTEILDRIAGSAIEMAKLLLDRAANNWQRRQAAGDLDWQMRQATGIAKAPYVAEYVRMLLESGEKVLLYGWHRAVYDIWTQRLADFNPMLYTGSESTPQKNRTYKAFTEGDCRLLIMSLRSGAGLDGLQQHARDVVFGELDWAPDVHKQATGRLRRGGMDVDRPVRAHYLIADEGSDPTIAMVHGLKRQQSDPLFNPDYKGGVEKVTNEIDRMKLLAAAVLEHAGEATAAVG